MTSNDQGESSEYQRSSVPSRVSPALYTICVVLPLRRTVTQLSYLNAKGAAQFCPYLPAEYNKGMVVPRAFEESAQVVRNHSQRVFEALLSLPSDSSVLLLKTDTIQHTSTKSVSL